MDGGKVSLGLSVPLLVLIIPLGFPTLRHLGRWRPGWRDEVGHVNDGQL